MGSLGLEARLLRRLRGSLSHKEEALGVALVHKEALENSQKNAGGLQRLVGAGFDLPTPTLLARAGSTLAQRWRVVGAWQGSRYEVERHAGAPKVDCRVPEVGETISKAHSRGLASAGNGVRMGLFAKEWMGAMRRWQSEVRGWVGASQREAVASANGMRENLRFKLT